MEPPTTVAALKDVCFSYKTREILHNVNISIPRNSMTAIVGPNGGGKTTLLKLILGMLKPNRGTVELLGETPLLSRSRVGYVPQKLDVDPQFPVSALDVVQMGLLTPKRSRARGSASRQGAMELLGKTHAEHIAKQRFSRLSGGERQRVLIAKSLASNPELLVMDEPTANVDPHSEHELYQLFQELNQTIPILFVSHNLNVVSRNVSHVVCVNKTADLHRMQDVLESTFTELYGGTLAVIHHGETCHINDPSHAMNQPHGAAASCECNHEHE